MESCITNPAIFVRILGRISSVVPTTKVFSSTAVRAPGTLRDAQGYRSTLPSRVDFGAVPLQTMISADEVDRQLKQSGFGSTAPLVRISACHPA
jgi:hypothetical protein